VKRAIDVAPFDQLADPRVLAELAAAAEERGWDGFFVWDHIVYRAPVRAVADPWVALVGIPPGDDPEPWERAGATWTVTDFGMQPTTAEVGNVIDEGPG
jgi:hypothetical protein